MSLIGADVPDTVGVRTNGLPNWFNKWPPRVRQILQLLVVLTCTNLLYWFLIVPSLFGPPKTDALKSIAFTATELATLKAPTLAAAEAATYKPITLPHTECCEPVYLGLKMTFDAPKIDADGLGVLNFHQVDNFIVVLNGSIIQRKGTMEFGEQSFEGQTRSIARLPTGLLKSQGNTLTYITVRHGFPYTDLEPVKIAPFENMEQWSKRRIWSSNILPYITATITFLLGAFALIIALRTQSRAFPLWLMTLSWLLCANLVYAIALDPPFGGTGRMIAFFGVNSAIPVALLCFVDAWSNKPIPWLQPIATGSWVTFLGFCVWALNSLPMSQGFDLPAEVWTWHSIVFGTLIVARIGWHFVSQAEERYAEAVILSIVGFAIGLDGVTALLDAREYVLYLKESSPLLLVCMSAAFLQRNFQLFQSADALNNHLAEQLTAREQELKISAAALREQEAQTAIQTERARIMRDMHDGMGGQLLTLLMQARDPDTERSEMEDTVETAITDLRLLVDSLDSMGDSLEIALASFRERLAPRLAAANVKLDWPNTLTHLDRTFAPAEVLSIYRILQETISNAVRHGRPTVITVTQIVSPDTISIILSDNGIGMAKNAQAGRGLSNMRRRAEEIGGIMVIEPNVDSGVRVTLQFPAQTPLSA